MDGLPPPPATFAAPMPASVPPPPPPPGQRPTPAPVGRPLADPEKQEQKVRQAQEQAELEEVLPPAATDAKIMVWRSNEKGQRVGTRPICSILVSELKEAKDGGKETVDYIKEKLSARFPEGSRFQCVPSDKRGNPYPKAVSFTVVLGDNASTEFDMPEDDTREKTVRENIVDEAEPPFQNIPPVPVPRSYRGFPPELGFVPNPDQVKAAIEGSAKVMIEKEDRETKRSTDMMTVVMSLMQQQQAQQQSASLQLAQIMAEQTKFQQQLASERESRDEKMRQEKTTLLTTLLPLLMPVVQKLMEPKPNETTAILLKLLDNKGNNDGMQQVMQMMSEATKNNMALQSEAAKIALQSQAKATEHMVSNVMSVAQQVTEASLRAQEPAAENETTLEKTAKIFQMFAPVLQSIGQQPPPPPQLPVAASVPPQTSGGRRMVRVPQQAPPAAPAQPAAQPIPPQQKVRACLFTIMRLDTGEGIPNPESYWAALNWCAQNASEDMQKALRENNEAAVSELGGPILMSDATLRQWASTGDNGTFLAEAIQDVIRLVGGKVTAEYAAQQVAKLKERRAKRAGEASAPAPAAAAPAEPAAVEAEEVPEGTTAVAKARARPLPPPVKVTPVAEAASASTPAPTGEAAPIVEPPPPAGA